MCLAILMYIVTGALALLWHVAMTVGIFLLTLLGKAILFVCASIYTVAKPIAQQMPEDSQSSMDEASTAQPFVTMYPEISNFEEDYETMARVSLETVTSSENSPRPGKRRRSEESGTTSGENSPIAARGERKVQRKVERTADGRTEARLQRGHRQSRQVNK